MTDEAYRFMVQGHGYQLTAIPANEDALRFLQGLTPNSFFLAVPKSDEPAKLEAHRAMFVLLREMHSNWPGESMSFEWWRASLKRWLIPGACEVRETKRGPVPLPEDWSPYKLTRKRQLEIFDAVKQVARDVLKWTDDDIDAVISGRSRAA